MCESTSMWECFFVSFSLASLYSRLYACCCFAYSTINYKKKCIHLWCEIHWRNKVYAIRSECLVLAGRKTVCFLNIFSYVLLNSPLADQWGDKSSSQHNFLMGNVDSIRHSQSSWLSSAWETRASDTNS
jgi:hypothetical protein